MRHDTVNHIQRTLLLISFLALGGIALIGARVAGFGLPGTDGLSPQGVQPAAFNKQIVIISGHAGFDSGAVCTDAAGEVTLAEADVNAAIAADAARRLRRAGADVDIYDEYDDRLDGLRADLLLSLHADSCIDASGYKAANSLYSHIPAIEERLLVCIQDNYGAATGLEMHANTVTHNMTEYHAFNRIAPETPGAILEMGFLGGDQVLLTDRSRTVAKGVADSVLCFFTDAVPDPGPDNAATGDTDEGSQ